MPCAFPKPRPRAAARRDAARQHRESIAEIRAAVVARAKGRCEALTAMRILSDYTDPARHTGPLRADHWLGGAGRRRQQQSTNTVWAICPGCDLLRTNNWPSAAWWNRIHEAHCRLHGLPFTPHIEKAPGLRKRVGGVA